MRLKAAFLTITVLFAGYAQAQAFDDVLTEKLSRQFAASNFPGFCVSVVNDSKVLYQKGFGYSDTQTKTPYTVNTVQPIGSVSKTFIGVSLMKAVELGYFSLDSDINEVLDFRVSNPNSPKSSITVRHLATHTSGITDRKEVYEKTYSFGPRTNSVSLKTFLSSYLTEGGDLYSKQNFGRSKPGERFEYSNIGATLAAYLIEVKAKMTFAEFSEKFVLKPLAMDDSGWFDRSENANLRATLYDSKLKPYPSYSSITYPDGSLRSSCASLSKFLIEVIKGYNDAPNPLLSKGSFKTMISPQFPPQSLPMNTDEKEANQGIFFVFRRNGLIGHTGGDPGVSAFMFFNPKTNIGRIFLTNVNVEEDQKLATQFAGIWKTLDG